MILLRAFLVWLAIIPLAILNGGLREAVVARWLGPVAARALSGVLLCAAILVWTALTIGWIGLPRRSAAGAVGAAWLVLTVAFEFGLGRFVARKSWPDLLRPYRFAGGDLWPLVLLTVTLAPLLAYSFRHH